MQHYGENAKTERGSVFDTIFLQRNNRGCFLICGLKDDQFDNYLLKKLRFNKTAC